MTDIDIYEPMFGKSAPTPAEQQRMRDLYKSGLLLREVAHETGFCVSTVTKFLKLNGCAIRRRGPHELGIGPVKQFDDTVLVALKAQWDKLSTQEKGTIAETHTKARLAGLGFDVWEPFCHNHQTDLIVLVGSRVRRVQVKSATYDTKTKSFRANISRHRHGGGVTFYSEEHLDFFIVYCGGLAEPCFYVVPLAQASGRSDIKCYPHRPKGKDSRGVSWEAYRDAFSQISG